MLLIRLIKLVFKNIIGKLIYFYKAINFVSVKYLLSSELKWVNKNALYNCSFGIWK